MRRLTQIDLAVDANVSAKHLCFLETGRSQPSREMVQLLCSALDLPLEERNALHVAAGFVPPYSDKGLAADHLQPVRQALDFILRQQEPYPGIVVDGRWDVRMRNQGSARLLKPFRDSYEMEARVADNAMHVVFHPKGLRQFIVNWDEFAGQLIQICIATSHKAAGRRRSCSMKSWPIPACRPNGRLPRQVLRVITSDDHAPRQGRTIARLLLHLYDAGDADGRRAATDQDRMLLSGGRRDRRERRGNSQSDETPEIHKEMEMRTSPSRHQSTETIRTNFGR